MHQRAAVVEDHASVLKDQFPAQGNHLHATFNGIAERLGCSLLGTYGFFSVAGCVLPASLCIYLIEYAIHHDYGVMPGAIGRKPRSMRHRACRDVTHFLHGGGKEVERNPTRGLLRSGPVLGDGPERLAVCHGHEPILAARTYRQAVWALDFGRDASNGDGLDGGRFLAVEANQ